MALRTGSERRRSRHWRGSPRRRDQRRPNRRRDPARKNQLAEPAPAPDGGAADIAPEIAARIEATARRLVDQLTGAPVGSAAFNRAVRAIDRIGEREIRATAEIAARFSERPVRAIRDILEDDAPLAAHVREVRSAAVVLARMADRSRKSESGRVAEEIARSQESMRALVSTLDAQRAALMADNAELAHEERALFHEIQTLRRYATLVARIEELVEDHSASIAASRPDDARVLQAEILYALRQRRRDVLVQLTIASQAYASLRVIEQNNLEVIWALRSAASTTLAALRTAGLAARTLQVRRAAEDRASELQATRDAWSDLLKSLDEVDARRRRTLSQMSAGRGRSA